MRHRLPHFAHIFASDSYSAGYYSYLWADTLTADAAEAFQEAGGLYDREPRAAAGYILSAETPAIRPKPTASSAAETRPSTP
jgi:Zn-dependent oligopeptidase